MRKDFYLRKWTGEFGQSYTKRCNVDYRKRKPIFKKLLKDLNIECVLEYGCNIGHNLKALHKLGYTCWGLEPNGRAVDEDFKDTPDFAIRDEAYYVLGESLYKNSLLSNAYNLTFTAGVLIHIPPRKIKSALEELYRTSNNYIMMIEYFTKKSRGRIYREWGREGVWSRDFGKAFKKLHKDKVELVRDGFIRDLGNDGWGFTDCKYWIFRKV